jgi:hypothetical protein
MPYLPKPPIKGVYQEPSNTEEALFITITIVTCVLVLLVTFAWAGLI